MKIPIEKQKEFIQAYEQVHPVYEEFAQLITTILNKAVEELGYLAIVQARAKKVNSFAGKIISKDKYLDPLNDVTDLCGARVILHFQSQVADVCRFIRENFAIDEANSLDHGAKLRVNEFGYRSTHYIITPKKEQIAGIAVDEKFRSLKAEIQVRTLAEHIWADISHDRIYKTDLVIPEEWKREAARLSALLENADKTFASISQAIDAVSHVYDLQIAGSSLGTEPDKLKTLAEIYEEDPKMGPGSLLDFITFLRRSGKTDEALRTLTEKIPLLEKPGCSLTRLNLEKALLSLELSLQHPSPENRKQLKKRAMELLGSLQEKEIPCSKEVPSLGSLAYRLGALLHCGREDENLASEWIGKAYTLMPENPLYFTAMLEDQMLQNRGNREILLRTFRNIALDNLEHLRELIVLGIEKVPAWCAEGRIHLMLGNAGECLQSFAKAVSVFLDPRFVTPGFDFDLEIGRLERLKPLDDKLVEQALLLLRLARSLGDEKDPEQLARLGDYRLRRSPFRKPVVILAGGAGYMEEVKALDWRPYVEELMNGFKGTVISGGTDYGIPGLAGSVRRHWKEKGAAEFDLLAYLPGELPESIEMAEGYDEIYRTDAGDFSALDILSMWTDIILSGIRPEEVILVGIGGGKIARLEYILALALGARVCLVSFSGGAVFELLNDTCWKDFPNLVTVPEDPRIIWALVNQGAETVLTPEETDWLAREVHEFYKQERLSEIRPGEKDINKFKVVMEWEQLEPGLKRSNIRQVGFYRLILGRAGLGIRKSENPVLLEIEATVGTETFALMASLEHARWCAERLLDGWKYGPAKDLSKKINPSLLPWEALSEGTQSYDYNPIRNIPRLLAKVGYEVFMNVEGN